MATTPVTIELDAEAASAYAAASEEERRKIRLLLNAWLRDLAMPPAVRLRVLMDEISDKAQARGLTPEILDSLLHAE